MWLEPKDLGIISSIPGDSAEQKIKFRVHPNCLIGAKAVSIRGVTGRVTKVYQEALQEDRYDSIDIEWDHGGLSRKVFLLWLNADTPGVNLMISTDKYNANKIYY